MGCLNQLSTTSAVLVTLGSEMGVDFVQMDVLLPAAAGVIATLLGVVLGGVLTRRQQVEAWSRDRQVEACAAIVRESTRVQLNLRHVFRGRATTIDWAPWNEALAVLHLVGHPDAVAAAQAMDEAIWRSSHAVRYGGITGEDAWAAAREPLEATRLQFINTARRRLLANREPLHRLVARPSLADLGVSAKEITAERSDREAAA